MLVFLLVRVRMSQLSPIGLIYKTSVSHNPRFEIHLISFTRKTLRENREKIEKEERDPR